MAYTAVPTITTGDVATAAWGNTYIKDNFAAGVPDIFTTDGDIAVGTGANAAERVSVMNASNFVKHEVGGLEFDASGIAAGGVFYGSGTGTVAILTIGSANQVLQTNSGATNIAWATVAVTEATAADMEDQGTTNANRYVSPEIIRRGPTSVKLWGSASASGSLAVPDYNISSLDDLNTGKLQWNFGVDFSDADIAVVATADSSAFGAPNIDTDFPAVGSIRTQTNDGTTNTDAICQIVGCGDQDV